MLFRYPHWSVHFLGGRWSPRVITNLKVGIYSIRDVFVNLSYKLGNAPDFGTINVIGDKNALRSKLLARVINSNKILQHLFVGSPGVVSVKVIVVSLYAQNHFIYVLQGDEF